MAFVHTPALAAPRAPAPHRAVSARRPPTMSAGHVSRRGLLRLAVAAAAAAAAPALALSPETAAELKELKKDVEELKYDDEVVDVGPDSREKNPTNIKKKEVEPEYRKEDREDLAKDDQAFDDMVAKEQADAEALRKKFAK